MLGFLQAMLAPYYIYIKFVHVVAVFGWLLTATCAYAFYLVPVMKAWRRHPDDPEIIPVRNWVLERFDEVVTFGILSVFLAIAKPSLGVNDGI